MHILEICQRARSGPAIEAQAFDLDVVYTTARELSEKHDIHYDPATPVPDDDALADRLFQAGREFVARVGVYCPDTGRIIRFEEAEIDAAVAAAPGRCVMGEGKDRHVWTPRRPESPKRPWYHVGAGITVSDDRIAFQLARGYASIPLADSISVSALQTIDGVPIVSGDPSEVLGAIRAMRIARQALEAAGRPGLAIGNGIAAAGSALATLAASGAQFGLRPSDGWLAGSLAEMKCRMDTLCKGAFFQSWGANLAFEAAPMVGGYAGGPAGTAILDVAYRLVGRLLLNCDHHLAFPIDLKKRCTTTREVLWVVAASNQAASRNTSELVWANGYAAAGPMTKQYFLEAAAYAAAAVSSGASLQLCHPAKAVKLNGITPGEMRGALELAEAMVGISRRRADEIVLSLLPEFEDALADPPPGKTYPECFDVNTGQPSREYVDFYDEVVRDFAARGITMRARPRNASEC